MTEIFRAGRQLVKVRIVMFASLVAAAAACWYGWDLFQTYGLRPADGGVLAPLWARLAWGLTVASLGLAFAAGMWVYGRDYAARIRLDQEAGDLLVYTVSFIGTIRSRHAAGDVRGSGRREGKLVTPHGISVDAPWLAVRIAGRRRPLIVDAQGHFPDPALAARILKLG
jgi:hypothetical protein